MAIARPPKIAEEKTETDKRTASKRRTRKAASKTQDQEKQMKDFIKGAPDGRKWKLKGRRVVITHTLLPEDLEKLDEMAEALDMRRATLLNLIIKETLKRGTI